jgi:NADH-quinone oxidoreductase subunit B
MRWSLVSAETQNAAVQRGQEPDPEAGTMADQVRRSLVLGRLQDFVAWGQKYSIWPFNFGLSCCYVEMATAFTSKYDIARFGS